MTDQTRQDDDQQTNVNSHHKQIAVISKVKYYFVGRVLFAYAYIHVYLTVALIRVRGVLN